VTNSISEEQEKVAFFELADQLARTSDHAEQKHIKSELARMTFGESSDDELAPPDATR
jgi:hypothetical protein